MESVEGLRKKEKGMGIGITFLGMIYLLFVTYTVISTPSPDFGDMEWFYKIISVVVTDLLAFILIGIGNIISRMDKR